MSKFSKMIDNPKQFVIDSWLVQKVIGKGFVNNRSNVNVRPLFEGEALESKSSTKPNTKSSTKPNTKSVNPLNVFLEIDSSGYVFVPWIASHGDKLIKQIQNEIDTNIYPLNLNENISSTEIRRSINRYSKLHPDEFRKSVMSVLARNKNKIKAVLLTLDWVTPMRLIASVCNELEIKTILIPHEGVFADQKKYYKDISTDVDTPISDFILCWGEQQADIFIDRGYPKERLAVVGSPKLAYYSNYSPKISRSDFFKILSLDENIFTMLFVCQPLDSQYQVKAARDTQRQIIKDLISYSVNKNAQLIIRKPPSGDRVLNKEVEDLISSLSNVVIDYFPNYAVQPEEAVAHSSVVLSINSTMLFEALLSNTPAISTKYIEFSQQWSHLNLPAPSTLEQLHNELNDLRGNSSQYWNKITFEWAKRQLSCGTFDYDIVIQNIKNILDNKLEWVGLQSKPVYETDYFIANKRFNISFNNKLTNSNKFLPQMLGVKEIKPHSALGTTLSADTFLNWGISETKSKCLQKNEARKLGKQLIYVEDGFLRSKDIGLSGETGLSIILDSKTAYYDASKPSQLEDLLNSKNTLTFKQIGRAKKLIHDITQYRLSKYNHAPDVQLEIGGSGTKKILLIDQRYGDMSVEAGLANPKSFQKMLLTAINDYPEYEILIKRHPDAMSGGKRSYFDDKNIGFTKGMERVHLIDYEVNPHSLFDLVEKVFCVTSGMGFEALLRGKEVHTFGMPFYAGWGLTQDILTCSRRTMQRNIQDVFHYSYIVLSRYVNPISHKGGEIENVIEYLGNKE